MFPHSRNRVPAILLLAGSLLLAAGCGERATSAVEEVDRPELGLLTTLPIYWNETAELGEMLSDVGPPPKRLDSDSLLFVGILDFP